MSKAEMDLISQTEFEVKRKQLAERAYQQSLQRNHVIANRDITFILELWGAYNRSGLDNLGFGSIAAGFKTVVKHGKMSLKCSENDAIIIDSILNRLAQSHNPERQAMRQIIIYYYVGIEDERVQHPIPCKSMKTIGKLIGYGETKTAKLREAAENYICGSLDALNIILECEAR